MFTFNVADVGFLVTGLFAKLVQMKQLRHYVMLRLGKVSEREMVYCYERIQGLSGSMDMDYSNAGEFMIGQAFEAAVRHREGLDEENDEERWTGRGRGKAGEGGAP